MEPDTKHQAQVPSPNSDKPSDGTETLKLLTAPPVRIVRPWKTSRGPIKVDRYSLSAAHAIDALLTAPLGVLPKGEGDIVLPLQIGVGAEIESRLRVDGSLPELRKAIRRYAYSAGYVFATAQPDAQRHDIDGNPVEPVSERDRLNAQSSLLTLQEHKRLRREQRESG